MTMCMTYDILIKFDHFLIIFGSIGRTRMYRSSKNWFFAKMITLNMPLKSCFVKLVLLWFDGGGMCTYACICCVFCVLTGIVFSSG